MEWRRVKRGKGDDEVAEKSNEKERGGSGRDDAFLFVNRTIEDMN